MNLDQANRRIRELEKELRTKAIPVKTKAIAVADHKAIFHAVMSATKQYRKMLQDQADSFKYTKQFAERIIGIAERNLGREIPAQIEKQPVGPSRSEPVAQGPLERPGRPAVRT